MRALIANNQATPVVFRAALTSVPPADRDCWLDLILGLAEPPDDGPDLPRGGVPYLPCPVDTILRMVDQAEVRSTDVFVDIGSGVGRATALTHLLTGAGAIGLEIQSELVRHSRDLRERMNTPRVTVVEGDAARLTGFITIGSVFFLYCPFGGQRLERVLDDLESIALTREIRVCSVHLPLFHRPWLVPVMPPSGDLAVYRSTHLPARLRTLTGSGATLPAWESSSRIATRSRE
jgi:SAM-dependent methyltransferase